MIEWVETKLSRPEAPVEVDQPSKPLSVEDLEMPDIYAIEHVDTVPDLKILGLSSSDIDESTGFDPYDTVVLHEKQGVKKG